MQIVKEMVIVAVGLMLAGCESWKAPRVEAPDAKAWATSEWISVASSPVAGEAEKAEYKSAAGLIRSAWRYEGDKWIWDFTVPEGATASVTLPGESAAKPYVAGTYHIER